MYRIAVVEDDSQCAQDLTGFISQYGRRTGTEFSVRWYESGLEFLEDRQGYDIVCMDISLPGINGMDVARELRERDSVVILIFVTLLSQYAVKGYEVDALDYMIKPVSFPLFALKLDRALRLLRDRDASYMINTREGMVRVRVSEIFYVESMEGMLPSVWSMACLSWTS